MAQTEPLAAQPQNLRETVHIVLDEMLAALAECCRDLDQDQLWLRGACNIASAGQRPRRRPGPGNAHGST